MDVAHVAARYPYKDLLMSEWLTGERLLANQAALVETAVGRGRVIMLGFAVQHRGQPHDTFKFLFNSLLLSTLVDDIVPGPSRATIEKPSAVH